MNLNDMANAAKQIGQMGNNLDAISKMVNACNNGGNPMQLISAMAQSDPRFARVSKILDGKSPEQLRTIAENMCRERGTTVEQMAQNLGLKR